MLETLTGIGPKTKQALSHLGIYTLEDFIEYYPYRYELIRRTNMEEAKEDDSVIIDGTVTNIPRVVYFKKHMERMNFRIQANDRWIDIVIFNRSYLKKELNTGNRSNCIWKVETKEKSNCRITTPIWKIRKRICRKYLSFNF